MAASTNRPAWASSDDTTFFAAVVIVLGLAFFGWIAWINYHPLIAWAVADLAHWEIGLVRHFSSKLDGLDRTIAGANLYVVTVSEIFGLLNAVGVYLRIPVIVVILVLALLCFTRAAPSRFTRKLDLDDLMLEQAQFYQWTAPFAHRKLRLMPLLPDTIRPCDPALHAREWAARFARNEGGDFDPEAAVGAFTVQLGPVWQGLDQAAGHVRVLAAVFVLHLNQQRTEAVELLKLFGRELPKGGPGEEAGPAKPCDVPRSVVIQADQILQHETLRRSVNEIMAAHAYTAPGLMSLLTLARRRAGVLAPAQFGGLKLVDRSLWYALHSLGVEGDGPGQSIHPNAVVEAAGARDHWAAERLVGRPLILPSVRGAVNAVRAVVNETTTNTPKLEV